MTVGWMPCELAERIAAIERKHAMLGAQAHRHAGTRDECDTLPLRLEARDSPVPRVLTTGLAEIDEALGGGLRPGMHEWYGTKFEIRNSKREEHITKSTSRFVPLCVLAHLAWRALEANPAKLVIWVGKECFPYPAVLVREGGRDLRLLRRSLFVQARLPADRVWAADLSIRCGLAGAIITDGSGLEMAATRRLQLAAKSHGVFVFLARPPQDLDRLSAATTRWLVRTGGMPKPGFTERRHGGAALGHATHPCWSLELLRCKGVQPSTSRRVWLVEWNRATNVIGVHTPVCDSIEQQARRYKDEKARRAM